MKEETGLMTKLSDWRKIGELHSTQFDVDVMAAIYKGEESDARSLEKEQVEWFSVNVLPKNMMSNLSWLIPICRDAIVNKEIDMFVTTYTQPRVAVVV